MELESLQIYWWLLISVLGALLVFLLFVQGGQTFLLSASDSSEASRRMISSFGHKWELTFTTLVVFGGAFFASFPLFYSTSFGGAYWLWMLILISFVLQAVSYEFRTKPGNIFGTRTYDTFLFINGCVGCILLGVAVSMFFFGAEFSVSKGNILDGSNPVISRWAPTHGLEAMADWRNLLLGVAVFFLARAQAAMYFVNNICGDGAFATRMRRAAGVNGAVFALLFVAFLLVLMFASGLRQGADGIFVAEQNIYLHNLLGMWWAAVLLLAGVVMALYGIFRTAFDRRWRAGIWFGGTGTALVVMVLFFLAGYRSTAYYPSVLDAQSSLSIANSSSSLFTLKVMSWVSVLVPFVLAYIAYVWRKMNAHPLTPSELHREHHQY